jgi:methylenetetrahydrofolate dehydrogenase (NADP+)/methenyltetrahydrofolate cyclohydrolase
MRLIDGRAIAAAIAEKVAGRAETLRAAGRAPTLAVVVPTRDEAAASYVRSIRRSAGKVGIACEVHQLDEPVTAKAVTTRLTELSADPAIHGVLCQTPLPAGVRLEDVGAGIDAAKDVDGANPLSAGRLACGLPTYAPATAAAILEILRH